MNKNNKKYKRKDNSLKYFDFSIFQQIIQSKSIIYNNKIQFDNKYNLLMNRFSEINFKETSTKPAKTHSPDYRSGNKIKPTKSPQNIEYILKESSGHIRTPTGTPTKESNIYKKQPNTIISRYFSNNRPSHQQYSPPFPTAFTQNKSRIQSGGCHNCCDAHCHCAYASNNQEVVIELRRIITMINGAQVSTFDPSGQDTKKQIQNLKFQNQKLLSLVDRLKMTSPEPKTDQQRLESQNRILRQQLTQYRLEHERQREQLYRTNKTLSSHLKSLEDRNSTNQKQIDSLKFLIRQKDQGQNFQSRKKSSQQKLSLSMIRQQYNQSIKILKLNWAAQIDSKMNDYQTEIRQNSMRLNALDERLKNYQQVMVLNRRLNKQVTRLKKLLEDKDKYEQLLIQRSSSNPDLQRLQKQKLELNSHIKQLTKQIKQQRDRHEIQISDLKTKNRLMEEKLIRETEDKVKKLMQTYEKQIIILKRQVKSNTCNHKDIELENNKLREQYERIWQEVLKLRNQLARQTSINSKMEQQHNNLKIQMNKLNHQLDDQFAKTGLLSTQITRLRLQLQKNQKQLTQKESQNQNQHTQLLKQQQQLVQKRNEISKLNHKLNNQHLKLLAHNRILENQNYNLKKQLEEINNQNAHENQQSLINQLTKIKSNEENLTTQLNRVKSQKNKLQEQVRTSKLFASTIKEDDEKQINKLRGELVDNALEISRLQTEIYEHKTQINKLNHQLSDNQLNYTAKTKHLENQIDQLKRQLENSESRAKYVPILEQQNQKLRQQISNLPNLSDIRIQFDNMQRNLKDKTRKCQQLEEQNKKLMNQLRSIRDQFQNQKEKKMLSDRQLQQLKNKYNNDVQKLQHENRIQISQKNALKQNLDYLSETYNVQSKQKQDRIVYLWDTIQGLNKNISETEDKVGLLENKILALNNQNQKLRADVLNTRNQYENILKLSSENWQYQINSLQKQNNRLKQDLIVKQSSEQTLIKKMSIKISSIKSQSLRKQLEELKKMVDQSKFDKLQLELTNLSDNYHKELMRSEQKTIEIDDLNKQKAILSDKISELQRVKLSLTQKINILEGNVRILESQLREKNYACQNHMNQKALLQKQNMLLKKSKIERQNIEVTRNRAREISEKIDRLLTLEKQRQKGLEQISREQSISLSSVVRRVEYPQI